jgi:hypothetical protein
VCPVPWLLLLCAAASLDAMSGEATGVLAVVTSAHCSHCPFFFSLRIFVFVALDNFFVSLNTYLLFYVDHTSSSFFFSALINFFSFQTNPSPLVHHIELQNI